MFQLMITMLEKLGIIVTIALVLTRLPFFRDMIYRDSLHMRHQITAIVFFGAFGIIGTYTGVAFNASTMQFNPWADVLGPDEAIANSRVIGVVLAGLFGGYRIGIGAGLIAGIHRFTLGGFTAVPCSLATVIAGVLSGIFYRRSRNVKLSTALLIGAGAEAIQMLVILLLARPFDQAWSLVSVIGLPMIAANGIGAALFLLIIQSVVSEQQKAGAEQTQKSLRIADETLGYMRQGMTPQSASAVCAILYREMNAIAISMTDSSHILAHIGAGDDHHQPGAPIQTEVTRQVLRQGEVVVTGEDELHCRHASCVLSAAVVAPLKRRGETIGTIKFYYDSPKEITDVVLEFIRGLSVLLGNQIELADADKANQLKKEAEIKVLQAQISPHFLFNSLNTVISLIRSNPSEARRLLVHLSHFFRQNLKGTTEERTTLETELKHVKAYLTIEEARFADKLRVTYEVDDDILARTLPPLTLQPLVENAVKHGLRKHSGAGCVTIFIRRAAGGIEVAVDDDGIGMPASLVERLRSRWNGEADEREDSERSEQQPESEWHDAERGAGVGLYNVDRRLRLMYGEGAGLHIMSTYGEGTRVSFKLPTEGEITNGPEDQSADRG
ncbi:sensor histidine kinase [Paenibacillus sp. J5C_2022]|uniref:sensor histidine kinase n=1 Tax=Paenibacillus sp. J5C2022 TaxID=2977129 RepID=UPI0021D0878F|nr:sensor histidine kinase [Paenibacillus sp. J5C2022]MCU6712610.1 sensor histidine kinase [Paenibacillus sp. J5C2022]